MAKGKGSKKNPSGVKGGNRLHGDTPPPKEKSVKA